MDIMSLKMKIIAWLSHTLTLHGNWRFLFQELFVVYPGIIPYITALGYVMNSESNVKASIWESSWDDIPIFNPKYTKGILSVLGCHCHWLNYVILPIPM